MIQRIQSFYLLVAAVLLGVASVNEFFVLNQGLVIIDGFNIYKDADVVFSTLPLNIILWIGAALSVVTIFLYKNRILQMRLTTYTIIILLGFYLLLIYYRYFGITKYVMVTDSRMTLYSLFPVIAAIFVYMANRAIKKDEEKVRSMDRFR